MTIWSFINWVLGGTSTKEYGRNFDAELEAVRGQDGDIRTAAPLSEEAAEDVGKWWGPTHPDADETPKARAIDGALYDTLRTMLDDPAIELPRMPTTCQRVTSALGDDDFDIREIVRLTQEDPVLSAEVLRLANSAAYRGIVEIDRLENAFVRLGQRLVRSTLLAACLKRIAMSASDPFRNSRMALWRRSLASGAIMARLAPLQTPRIEIDRAFLAGLLHDIGELVVIEAAARVARESKRVVGPELLRTAFAQWHEHLGCRLAGAWNLPSPLDEIISSHHALPEVGQPHATLRLMIQVTDAMCGKLGMCEGTTDTIFSLRCTDRLGLRRTPAVLRMLEEIPAALESTLGSSYTTSAS